MECFSKYKWQSTVAVWRVAVKFPHKKKKANKTSACFGFAEAMSIGIIPMVEGVAIALQNQLVEGDVV